MMVIDLVILDDKGMDSTGLRYFDDNGDLPDGNYNENEIAGKWLLIAGKIPVRNNLKYAHRSIDNSTLIKVL